MRNFALVGAAGFVAPRHMRAIRDTGNRLVALLDPHDAVGAIDAYAPEAELFLSQGAFVRHLQQRCERGDGVEWVSVCSPNDLHAEHVRASFEAGADVICEKPLVLHPEELDVLAQLERTCGRRVYTVLQLRQHPRVAGLHDEVRAQLRVQPERMFDVDLAYVTGRGRWYRTSWKGDEARSGGVATNIGIHLFDMLQWVFGPARACELHLQSDTTVAGYLELAHARVRWLLSIDAARLPDADRAEGKRTHRSIRVGGREVEFSEGFTELHTQCYQEILAGRGHGVEDARPSIELVSALRSARPTRPRDGRMHPRVDSNSAVLGAGEGAVS